MENVELKMENHRLRQMLGMKAFADAGSPLSPPISSNSSSPMPQIIETSQMNISDSSQTSKTETDHKVVFIQRGLSPHSKFALCIFMFAVVSLNSVGSLILNERPNIDQTDGSYNVASARRAILSTMIDDVSKFDFFSLLDCSIYSKIPFVTALRNVLQLEKFGRVCGEFLDRDGLFDKIVGLW